METQFTNMVHSARRGTVRHHNWTPFPYITNGFMPPRPGQWDNLYRLTQPLGPTLISHAAEMEHVPNALLTSETKHTDYWI